MEQILNDYYADNAKKLHSVVDKIIRKKYGGTMDKDMTEFYSVANDVFADIIKRDRYDSSKGDFDGFLYGALDLAIIDEFKRQNRDKRKAKIEVEIDGEMKRVPVQDVYLDAPIGEDEDSATIGDTLQGNYDLTGISDEKETDDYNDNIREYLESLPELSRKIAKLIMKGYLAKEIKDILNLTDKQYQDSWSILKSYEKKRILFKDDEMKEEEEMNTGAIIEDVAERYKNTSYSIESISKQLRKKRIRDDHILQRHSGQWKSFARSELVSDILRGKSLTQIIISEEIKKGLRMQWLIDGKQRCTTLDDFLHDGFAISKNVKNYNIKYQTTKVDENGNEVLNEDGFTELEFKDFDIRGKKFSQLPEELQDIYKDRQIPVLYNMNCTKKDIADDIARFNRSRPMNKAQNGWLGLDEEFAEFVENIAKMQFFQTDFCGTYYTNNNRTSGAIRRIIVEAIMVSDFIEDFNKDFNKMCEFLTDEASDSNFTEFYGLVERLTTVCDEKVAKTFNARDSFLWLALFSRFSKVCNDDKRYIDFIEEFNESLHSKVINGKSFDDLNGKSTKDKTVVVEKMKHLETLMMDYLHIDSEECKDIDVLDFVKENVNPDATQDDINDYNDDLEILSLDVDNESKLLDDKNKPSLISMISYGYKIDTAIDTWFKDFFDRNNTYLLNQKENFLYMKADFEKYRREHC